MSERREYTRSPTRSPQSFTMPPGTAAEQCRNNKTVSTILRGYLGQPKSTIGAELARTNTLMEREDISGEIKDELFGYRLYLQSIVTERRWLDDDHNNAR